MRYITSMCIYNLNISCVPFLVFLLVVVQQRINKVLQEATCVLYVTKAIYRHYVHAVQFCGCVSIILCSLFLP